jgi:hypothetical protein
VSRGRLLQTGPLVLWVVSLQVVHVRDCISDSAGAEEREKDRSIKKHILVRSGWRGPPKKRRQ